MSGSMSDIPLGVKVPQPPDMLQSALRIGALQSYANQNKLFGAHQAVGEAMRASIGEDGEPDHNKLLGILRNDPRVDPAMLETVGTALTQRAQAQGFSDNQRVTLGRVLGGVLAQPDSYQTQGNYNAAIDDAVKSGALRPEQADIARKRLAAAGGDVGKLRTFGAAFLTGTMATPQVAQEAFPTVFNADQGPQVQPMLQQPRQRGGTVAPTGPAYAVQPGPGFREPIVTWKRPDGTEGQGSLADFQTEQRAGKAASGPTITAPGQPAPARPANGAPGAAPPAAPPAAAPAPATTAPNVIPAPPHPGVSTTPLGAVSSRSPEATDAAKGTVAENIGDEARLNRRADAAPDNRAQYTQLASDIERFRTGPLTEKRVLAEGIIRQLTNHGITMTADQLSDAEGAMKVAKRIALAQADQMGGTDQGRRDAMGANPGPWLSNAGTKDILAQNVGNEDAIEAKRAAWQAWRAQNGAGTYDRFTTEFNKDFNPLSFQYRYYSDPVRAKMQAYFEKNPTEYARFVRGFKYVPGGMGG